jgi:vacuolar-type H+-ATPase subunit C/Vma6
MATREIALIARARGLSTHLVSRETLETLAEADDLPALARGLSRLAGAIDPVGEPSDIFGIERAIEKTANRHLRTLYHFQERRQGVLDVFVALQDRRSLRALLRGAAQGASPETRLDGVLPTPQLPQRALFELAHQASPRAVVGQLTLLAHPDAQRLLPVVQTSQPDLLAVDTALLRGFAERATRIASGTDETLRDFVSALIDVGNAQNALLVASAPRDIDPAAIFVHGGRWLTASAFVKAASAGSQQFALDAIATAFARSPLASSLPVVASDFAYADRAFLIARLRQLTRIALLEPLGTAPVLRVLLLIDAQCRDLRALAWGAVLGTPAALRKQQLVTPS